MLRRSLLVGLQMAPQKMTSAITSLHMARYYMLYLLHLRVQRAKKVVSDGQVKFFEEFKLQKNGEIHLLIKTFLGLVEMMFGLVNVSFSLPKWQAAKMTFFAP